VTDRSTYTSDEIESCRDNCDALLAAWGANDVEDGTLEAMVFTQAVVVLDAWFADRRLDLEGSATGAMGEVRVAPILPQRYLPVSLRNIRIGDARVSLRVDDVGVDVVGLPDGVRLVTEPRVPLTKLHEH